MNKRDYFKTVALSVLLTFALLLLLAPALQSLLGQIPLLRQWNLFAPQAPVVITTREVVGPPEPQNPADVASAAQSRLSAVAATDNGQVSFTGDAVNITSDGLFVAPQTVFPANLQKFSVILNDGRTAQVTQRINDNAAGLVFFRAPLSNVPVAPLGDSSALAAGDMVLTVSNSLQNYTAKLSLGRVSGLQSDVEKIVFNSDKPSRTFSLQSQPQSSQPGSAIVDFSGNVMGLWTGSGIISSDVLDDAVKSYLANPQDFAQPAFGFTYEIVTQTDSQLLGLPEGAQVKTVSAASAARQAGLQAGDIITAIDGNATSEQNLPEPILQSYQPGDEVSFNITRSKTALNLKLVVGKAQ